MSNQWEIEHKRWESKTYGCSVEQVKGMVRDSYLPPRDVAIDEIWLAAALIQSGKGESNREEILQALSRAKWILVNKVSADRPC
jgi:hypothetical protein